MNQQEDQIEVATFAGGCFWCTEAVFKRLKGVESVLSGYAGQDDQIPTYDLVSGGKTDFAEAIQIKFNSSVISFEKLLDVFFATHNPTQLNRQGNDVGPQYRSAIFFHDENQKNVAENKITELTTKFPEPIATTLEPFSKFYSAEEYHLDFYDRNKNSPYCTIIIDPKVQKLLKEFSNDVKDEYK